MQMRHEDLARLFDLLAASALKDAKTAATAGFDSSASYCEGLAYAYQFAAANARDKVMEFAEERARILDARNLALPSGT